MLEEAIMSRLTGWSGLTDLVGTSGISRGPAQQGQDPPYVVFFVQSTVPIYVYGGIVTRTARVQFACWGSDSVSELDVETQVRAAIDDWEGTLEGVTIDYCEQESRSDIYDDDLDQAGRAVDYTITYGEAA